MHRYVAQLDIKSAVARDIHQAVREAIDEVRVQHACYLYRGAWIQSHSLKAELVA